MKNDKKTSNILTLDGVIYKTGGNITFSDTDEDSYFHAHSETLREMNRLLETGMQTLLKKVKS